MAEVKIFKNILAQLVNESSLLPPNYMESLSQLSPQEAKELSEIWKDIPELRRKSILEDLENLSDSDYLMDFKEVFMIGLGDPEPNSRILAIQGLWEENDSAIARKLLSILSNDPSPEVQAQAASGLGAYVYLGELEEIQPDLSKEINTALFTFYSDQDISPEIRRKALESLSFINQEYIFEQILDAYLHGDLEWVATAIYAMGRSADDRWEKYILEALDHSEERIRLEAVRAAGELGILKAESRLIKALKETDDQIRLAAVWSLSEIGGDHTEDALNELLETTVDEEEIDIIENALENLEFTLEINEFALLDLAEDALDDDLDDFSNLDDDVNFSTLKH